MKRKIYDKLVKWKQESNGKYALLIEGARRVGKSYIVKEFAENNYKSFILTLIDTKKEYLDNYVFNAIVNHANYYYKSKKKNHINEDKIIEEIILNDYLKNKKKADLIY